MNLSKNQKSVCERVLNAWESGSADGNYSAIAIFKDGPHDIRQITYGRSQTTEYGNLRELVSMYVNARGVFSDQLKPFADKVGSVPLTDDATFKTLLRKAGKEDPIMKSTQDRFFDERYFKPAMKWADQNGFTEALSALVIYDSFVHSGSILWIIRNRFPESVPASGGKERTWISQYTTERNKWLRTHSREAVRASAYRTADLLREIKKENWDLSQLPILANKIKVSPVQ